MGAHWIGSEWQRPDEGTGELWLLGGAGVAWGVGAGLLAMIGRDQTPARDRPDRRRRHRSPSRIRTPWRRPFVWAYGTAAPVLVLGAGILGAREVPDGLAAAAVSALLVLLAWLSGIVIVLLGVFLLLVARGVVGFGGPLLTGRLQGRPVPRLPFAGPFLACLGLLLLPVVFAGAAAVDSPYRRDLSPLFGIVRDGVQVEHPRLLLAAQVATWTLAGCLLVGFVLWTATRRRLQDTDLGEDAHPGPEGAGGQGRLRP